MSDASSPTTAADTDIPPTTTVNLNEDDGKDHHGQEPSSPDTTTTPVAYHLSRQISNVATPKVRTGILGSSSNLVNSIVGSGIIGLPYAMRESGFVVALVLLVLVSYFTDKSLRMLINMATYHPDLKGRGVLTYEDLMSIPFGRIGYRFVLISMLVMAFGAMISYMIIIKDTVPTVLGLEDSFLEREIVMLVVTACTMLPLSMMRDISSLAVTSGLSILADVVLVVVVLVHSPISETVADAGGFGQVLKDHWINNRVFVGLGILSMAMACQHSAFLISGTLEHKTSARWAQVTKLSLSVAGSLSMVFSIAGYLGYLDETQGDILNNFDADSTAVNAGRGLLAITMVFTYPMESFVARHVLMQLLFDGNMDNIDVGPNGEPTAERKYLGVLGRREKWTLYLYLMALIPAMIFDDIGPVMSLTGSLGASALSYIGPGVCYLGLYGEDFLAWMGQSVSGGGTPKAANGGEVELPVVGDATAEIQTQPEPTYPHGSKPWWWFPAFMPIWVAIASSGARSTKDFVRDLDHASAESAALETIGPCKRDFIFSIVFVIFGAVAAALGVLTNVYVQVNDVYFSSH